MSVVYFIQRGDDGPIKIGYAKNAATRLDDLQVANAERLHLRGVAPGTRKTEKALHEQFANAGLRGEWFKPTTDLLDLIAIIGQGKTLSVAMGAMRRRRDITCEEDWARRKQEWQEGKRYSLRYGKRRLTSRRSEPAGA